MIIVTGDTHGDFRRLSTKRMLDILGEGDYLIIAGDCGLVWAQDERFEYNKSVMEKRTYTTLFIDGNHENFNMLNSYEIEEWHGGKVHHIVRDKVIHLMRGQVYTIEDKKIFTFGGGQSHDISGGVFDRKDPNFINNVGKAVEKNLPFRILNESWWEQEMPSMKEYREGIANLDANNWLVDYVITHSICSSMLCDISRITGIPNMKSDVLTDYLQQIDEKLTYKTWLCGHYHTDSILDDKHIVLYESFRELRTMSLGS